MEKDKAKRVVELMSIISELEKAVSFVETSDTILFTAPGRKASDVVTLDYGDETKEIISKAKKSAIDYIENKLKKYSTELESL